MAKFIITIACNLTKTGNEWKCGNEDDTTPSLEKAMSTFKELMGHRSGTVYITATAKESPPEGDTLMCSRMKEYLVEKGIPSFNVFTEKAATWNTLGEIRAAYEIIQMYSEANPKDPVEQVFICARWFHVWRAHLIGLLVKRQMGIKALQTPIPTYSRVKKRELPKVLFHEVAGTVKVLRHFLFGN